uniref:OB domain-containing protein n=1 Tax=Strigamia maritima TaxID=126957 RepID=T1ISM2_STRMM
MNPINPAQLEYTQISELKPCMKNLNMFFIILDIGSPTTTKKCSEVRICKVADNTGCVDISLWGEIGHLLESGDICRLHKGYASVWKGCLTLYTGEKGEIKKIDEFCMEFVETPNMSDPDPEFVKAQQEQLAARVSSSRKQDQVQSTYESISPDIIQAQSRSNVVLKSGRNRRGKSRGGKSGKADFQINRNNRSVVTYDDDGFTYGDDGFRSD